MGRQTSFWVLLIFAIGIGILFFRVIQPFVLPLLLACVVTLIVRPYYEWTATHLGNLRGITAALFAVGFIVVVLIPISGALYIAGLELVNAGKEFSQGKWSSHYLIQRANDVIETRLSNEEWAQIKESGVSSVQGMVGGIYSKTQALVANLVKLVIGLVITCLALFYFLAEGPQLVTTLRGLSPLEPADEEMLLTSFSRVCRGIVLATLVCAFFQAVAAGIGFAIAGVEKVWLLSVLTMFTSMIPFVGAAAVWILVAIGLAWNGSWGAAIFLTIYGTAVVSSLDNLLRAYVIHDSAQLHPLVALLSVLGAIQVMGLWGIFVGPIVASFFYALLKILRDRHWNASEPPPPPVSASPLC